MNRFKRISLIFITLTLVFLFTSCDDNSTAELNEDIEKYIHDYIVETLENESRPYDACFVSNSILYVEESEDITSVYLMQLFSCYILDEKGEPIEDSGGSIPKKYDVKNDGESYTIVNIEMPRDGNEYWESIDEIFPSKAVQIIKSFPDSQRQKKLETEIQKQIKAKYPDISFE